jgi:arylsulfatase A-like enzyme
VTRFACAIAAGLAWVLGCSRPRDSEPPAPAAASPNEAQQAPAAEHPVAIDITEDIEACSFGHDGVLVDIGDPAKWLNLHPGSLRSGTEEWVERQGASWLQVRSRAVSTTFYYPAVVADAQDAGIYVQARIAPASARSASIAVDGRTIGSFALGKGDSDLVLARPANPVLLATGAHDLTLHFAGGGRSGIEPFADVAWVHVGTGDPGEPYAAPTVSDALVDVSIGGRSLRAVSLRAPGFARCSGFVPADATLEAWLATQGDGDAEVEARIVRDRHPPVALGSAHVAGGGTQWEPWSVPVAGVDGAGELASVELVVKRAAKGTRVLFGRPRIVRAVPLSAPSSPTAKGVLLVILGSTPTSALAPWGGPHAVPQLTALAAAGTIGLANRAPSSLGAASVASMLTALPPSGHGLDDVGESVASDATMLEQTCREGGVSTAMFTADPTTGAAFGFARGWDTFVVHDPLEDVPATRVFDEAGAWIGAHASERFFVVVDARGGHPPWDATPDELKEMPPAGYVGIIDPHRAAEAIAKVRRHPARFREDDRARAWALYEHALDEHDRALGQLLGALQAAGRDADTTVIVTADVAANETAAVPFAEPDGLDEPLLATPLAIRWPRSSALAGRRIEAATSPMDIPRTVLGALGLVAPTAFQGNDLATMAEQALLAGQRPVAAMRGERFSVRWGPYVLAGSHDREARMCDLLLDPACIADVRGTSSIALESVRKVAAEALVARAAGGHPRPRPSLDERTRAALVRWGRSKEDEE